MKTDILSNNGYPGGRGVHKVQILNEMTAKRPAYAARKLFASGCNATWYDGTWCSGTECGSSLISGAERGPPGFPGY